MDEQLDCTFYVFFCIIASDYTQEDIVRKISLIRRLNICSLIMYTGSAGLLFRTVGVKMVVVVEQKLLLICVSVCVSVPVVVVGAAFSFSWPVY